MPRAEAVFYDGGLDGLIANVNEMHACTQQPTTYAEATDTFSVGSVAMVGGDFTKGGAAGTDPRTLTVAAKTLTGSATGTATHLALADGSTNTLYYVTTCTSVGMESTVEQDFSEWVASINAPTTA